MRATLPREVVHQVRVSTWHALFGARGYPAGLTKSASSHEAIAAALSEGDHAPLLARALFTIAAFATDAARADLYAAAAALGYRTEAWADAGASSPADLAASLLARSPTDATVAELVEAAQVLRDRAFRPRATHVYVGSMSATPVGGGVKERARALREEASAWCAQSGFGAVLPVVARTASGVQHYEIAHEDRRSTSVVVEGDALVARESRAVRSHALAFDSATGGLAVTTDCMEAVTPLATIAGRVFFGDARHFLDAQAVDLWKLQELGPGALEIPELSAQVTMRAIGGTWHSGKGHAITPRGRDLFKALARYKIRIEGGRLDLVTLRGKLAVSDGGPSQCDVALRPPHQVTVSEPEHAPLMHAFLDRARITRPEPRSRDFYAHQPWIDSRAGWVAADLGDFDALVAQGLLKADATNRTVAIPGHPNAGRTATAYPLRDGKWLACSLDPTIAPFVVRQEDLVAYTLSFARLSAVIAGALGLTGGAPKLDDDGVLYCGRRTLGPTYVLVFVLTRPIRAATVERLREAAEHGHAILVTPEARMEPNGLRQLAMPKLVGPWQPLVAGMVRALKLESKVDTTLYAPEGARVVLHRATGRAWFDGVLCLTVHENAFRLLEVLLAAEGGLVHTKEIADFVARGKSTEDTTRRAIDALGAAVVKGFKEAKRKLPRELKALVEMPRHGYYRVGVKGFVD